MKKNEFWLGVCLLAAILIAVFAGNLWPLFDQPLYSRIGPFFHSHRSARNFSVLTPAHRISVREEQPRG